MEILKKIRDRIAGRNGKLGIAMAALVLASACFFARDGFWEMVDGTAVKNDSKLIILDAGHGGNDPGKVGVDGVLEKDLNLVIAKKVQKLLEQQDMQVLMTREDDGGLYDENASNKKAQDMKRRCELINQEQPACVVSIHQNSYHEESIHGAQVFYYSSSKESGELAEILQEELISFVDPQNRREAKGNDSYYLLKKTQVPVVIVECGFLSNWEECGKLQDEDYQDRVAWAVHMGILKYMNGK